MAYVSGTTWDDGAPAETGFRGFICGCWACSSFRSCGTKDAGAVLTLIGADGGMLMVAVELGAAWVATGFLATGFLASFGFAFAEISVFDAVSGWFLVVTSSSRDLVLAVTGLMASGTGADLVLDALGVLTSRMRKGCPVIAMWPTFENMGGV